MTTVPEKPKGMPAMTDAQQYALIRIASIYAHQDADKKERMIRVGRSQRYDDVQPVTLHKLVDHGMVEPGWADHTGFANRLMPKLTKLGEQVATYLSVKWYGKTPAEDVAAQKAEAKRQQEEWLTLAREVKKLARTSTLPKEIRDRLKGTAVASDGSFYQSKAIIYPVDAVEILRATQKEKP